MNGTIDLFYSLAEGAPDAIFVGSRGVFIYVNSAAVRLFGADSADQLVGQPVMERIHPNDRGVVAQRIRQLEEREAVSPLLEETYVRLDGTLVDVEVSAVPFLFNGETCGLIFARDISKRKQAEADLRRSQQLLRSIIDNTMAVIFAKDAEGRYLFCNRRFSELFHVGTDAIRGRVDADIFPAAAAARLAATDRQVLAHGEAREFEETVPQDDGPHTYIVLKFPLRNEDGQAYGVCGIATDITPRKQSEREIRTLNQSLEKRVAERTGELRAKEVELREILSLNESIWKTSAVGIAAYRQDGQCVLVNPAFAAIVGGAEEQILRQNFRSLKSWRDSGLLPSAEIVLATGESAEHGIQLTTSFGRHLWVRCQLSRFISQGAHHLLLMIDDVTAETQAKEALVERERHFRTLADSVPDNIMRCQCDGRVLYLNQALEGTLGQSASEMIGKTPQENFPDGRFAALQEAFCRVGTTGVAEDFEQTVVGPNGELEYHLIRIVPEWGADGKPASIVAVGRDLTRQKKVEEELRLAATVFHNSAEGVIVTDADGLVLSVNPAFENITGYTDVEVVGRRPSLLKSDRHSARFYESLRQSLVETGQWQGELWSRRKSGDDYLQWMTINRIADETGAAVRHVLVFHDITELRRKDERIRYLAFHDPLTGLPNRALLQDRLRHAIARARREGLRLAVIFIDLDRFKAINDGLGHDAGDLLLQEVGRRIGTRLRAMDTLARMGGDEFVIVAEDLCEPQSCAGLAQSLIREISRPMELCGDVVEIGASAGIALFPEDGESSLELMKCADMAMYAAKAAGRNTCSFYQREMLDRTNRRLAMERDLRRAIANSELELHYQPKIMLTTGAALGVEALLRWRHSSGVLLPPLEFVPLAEESGLAAELGAWVLDEACRQSAEWSSRGITVKIAVNISAREVDEDDLPARILALTARHRIDPAALEIELTESAVMANPDKASGVLARLRAIGVSVAIDDFGTGYSSLAYLRRLPIDVLKIDRSFVVEADRDEDDAQIIKTILALGQALKLTVVAEGIETPRQLEILKSLGCDFGQGYLFARPMPARDVEGWLTGQRLDPLSPPTGSQ